MRHIAKDEMYVWMPESNPKFAEAIITDELYTKLCDAIEHYKNVCLQIEKYLEENPDQEIRI